MTPRCLLCRDTFLCMEDPRAEWQSDRLMPCPHCATEDYRKYLRGEDYTEMVPVPRGDS